MNLKEIIQGASTLRPSSKENPLSQEEVLNFFNAHSDAVFDIAKIAIDVTLTKAKGGETIKTTVLARDGRTIEETTNTAKEGHAIDSRRCINGAKDQYTKKPEKVSNLYELEGGKSFADLAPGETVKAKTVGGEKRQALVAQEDLYLNTTWGEVQFVAKGGLITLSGQEAIGNNNPCDMVFASKDKQGTVALTEPVHKLRADLEKQGLLPTEAMEGFLKTAAAEDKKNPYRQPLKTDLRGR